MAQGIPDTVHNTAEANGKSCQYKAHENKKCPFLAYDIFHIDIIRGQDGRRISLRCHRIIAQIPPASDIQLL